LMPLRQNFPPQRADPVAKAHRIAPTKTPPRWAACAR
jgi:hypothetical protein